MAFTRKANLSQFCLILFVYFGFLLCAVSDSIMEEAKSYIQSYIKENEDLR